MATQAQTGGWQRFRRIFRRCRITALLVILAAVLALVYLDTKGLPDFIKKPLLEKLNRRGLDLQFSRLRWQPLRGIIADNVSFGGTNNASSPKLTLKEVQVRLEDAALLKGQIQVRALVLRQGRFAWPIDETNGLPRELAIDNIQTELQLLTNDIWELDNLQAQFAGANFQLSGAITNASVVRDWKLFQGKQPEPPYTLQEQLRRLSDALEQIHFPTAPALKLDIRGDARDVENMAVRLSLDAPGADTPWGTFSNATYSVLLGPPPSNQLSRAEVKLRADFAATKWASVTNLFGTLHLYSAEGDTNLVLADLELSADSVQSRSNHAEQIHIAAQWLHSLTNAVPLFGTSAFRAENVVAGQNSVKELHFTAMLNTRTNSLLQNADWAWWAMLAPYPLRIEAAASGVHSPKLDADEIQCTGQWTAPELNLEKVSAKLYGGKVDADAMLNVASREVTFHVSTDFDAKKVSPLLTRQAQEWMANYSWNVPPQVKAEGALVMPVTVWTNRHPDWRGETRPSLRLAGEFHAVDGAFRGVPFSAADSHFIYSNMVWNLPDLIATRPEGNLILSHESNDRTQDYHFRFHSTIDPHALRLLVPEKDQRGFDLFTISQPPVIDGDVWGRWHHQELIYGKGWVAATNFTVRGETAEELHAGLEYSNSNRILRLTAPRLLVANAQELTAASVTLAIDGPKIFVTNGYSTADPMVVARAIGPQAERAIAPYHFRRPPKGWVEGIIPVRDVRDADLHFDVDGGQFQCWKLQVPRIAGKIDWVGQHLSVRDVRTDFYLGKGSGDAEFEFAKDGHSANFKFNATATNSQLGLLAFDLTNGKTNKLEGLLSAQLHEISGNTTNLQSCQGAGHVSLHDGLIWDIPIFGIFSPVLDTIMPGLGSSRAREGSATFVITNGVVGSGDLKIETVTAQLRYWGTIDLKGGVDARMETELLHNAWVVGPVLSLALWPVSKTFEYHISGSIHNPKSDPVYIPKVFFLPLHPLETIRDMMIEGTNAVPGAVGPQANRSDGDK